MHLWKVLFLVALDGILAETRKAPIKNIYLRSASPEDRTQLKNIVHRDVLRHGESGNQPLYMFATLVSDPSRQFLQSRTETRDRNGEVRGEYSYMDGHYRVKVIYKAGRSGFTVIRQERTPLKNLNLKKRKILKRKKPL